MISARTHDKSRTRASVCNAVRNRIYKYTKQQKIYMLKTAYKIIRRQVRSASCEPNQYKKRLFCKVHFTKIQKITDIYKNICTYQKKAVILHRQM